MKHSPLILASGSPRRRELLASAGWVPQVVVPEVVELTEPAEPPEELAMANAALKARAVSADYPHLPVLGADTIVVQDRCILGKPVDTDEAFSMLRRLSNSSHEVITGVAIIGPQTRSEIWCVRTTVCFRALGDDEIERYVASGEPMDKAGGYGIQGLAAQFVQCIQGSYTNVVGLPLAEVVTGLQQLIIGEPNA